MVITSAVDMLALLLGVGVGVIATVQARRLGMHFRFYRKRLQKQLNARNG